MDYILEWASLGLLIALAGGGLWLLIDLMQDRDDE